MVDRPRVWGGIHPYGTGVPGAVTQTHPELGAELRAALGEIRNAGHVRLREAMCGKRSGERRISAGLADAWRSTLSDQADKTL